MTDCKDWIGTIWLYVLPLLCSLFWTAVFIILALLLGGCDPGQHSGHIYFHDPNHFEAVFDIPMTMSVDRDGTKVEASSVKPGIFDDIIKFFFLKPR